MSARIVYGGMEVALLDLCLRNGVPWETCLCGHGRLTLREAAAPRLLSQLSDEHLRLHIRNYFRTVRRAARKQNGPC